MMQNNLSTALPDTGRLVRTTELDVLDRKITSHSIPESECRHERDKFIEELKQDRKWYQRRRNIFQYLWLYLTLLSLVFGFATSIFIAMGWPNPTSQPGKSVLVALPAISTFIATILVHFRLRENWEIRELGRVELDEAIVKASFLPLNDPEKFAKELYVLKMERVRLSRLQTARFFATLSEKQSDPQSRTVSESVRK